MKVYEIKSLGPDGVAYTENLPLFLSVSTAKGVLEALAADRGLPIVSNPWASGQDAAGGCMFLQCHNVVEI